MCGWDESRSWCIVVFVGIVVAVKRRRFALLFRGRAGVYFQAVVNETNCPSKLLWTIVGLNAAVRHRWSNTVRIRATVFTSLQVVNPAIM